MRELVYHVATSTDGYIARPDGSVEGLLMDGEHVPDFVRALTEDYDTVLMGRATYEWGFAFGAEVGGPAYVEFGLRNYVFSDSLTFPSRPAADGKPAITFVPAREAAAAVEALKKEDGRAIYLCGGGVLAGALLSAGLVDRVLLKVNPVLFGDGIPVVAGAGTPLTLTGSTTYPNGVVLLDYRTSVPAPL